jgi:uncharacterized membrane protein
VGQCPCYTSISATGPACGPLGSQWAFGFGLSESGEVCGESDTCSLLAFAFTWQPPAPILPVVYAVDGGSARAVDVNRNNTVVGNVDAIGQIGSKAFRWHDGTTHLLPPLSGHIISEAHALNDKGTVVGMSNGSPTPAAVFWIEKTPTALDLPIGPTSLAEDINNNNQICGWMGIAPLPQFGATPFIWHDGVTTSLPLPPYAINQAGTATAINNLGDASGYFFVDDPSSTGFLRRACAWIDGKFIDLGTLPGFAVSHATDINDAREVAGYCQLTPSGVQTRGFVWRDGEMSSLADMLTTPGMIPEFANALNNSGQIAGTGLTTPGSAIVAFRLTPALPAIPGNTNCDELVNVEDIINVILDWNADGPVGGRPADVNRDNRIDVDDLIEVILNFDGV